MASSTKVTLGIGGLCLLASLAGCSEDRRQPTETEPVSPLAAILSDPVREPAPSVATSLGLTRAVPVDGVVYMSLPPGTVPRGARAVIRHRASGFARAAPMADGGLDPVPVPAAVGDTIEVLAADSAGATLAFAAVVPVRRPPKVVRTVPPKGRIDVPLNSVIIVVFSEPVSAQSVSPAGIRLTRDGVPVGAQVALSADGLRAELTPDQPLAANASYTLSITTEVTDLSGDRIEQAVEVSFRTGSAAADIDRLDVQPSVSILAPRETLPLSARGFDRAGYEVTNPAVTWSSADPTVATVSAEGVVTGVGLGTTTITATPIAATRPAVTATATIDVVELVFASVSAGAAHTCGLTTGGAAYCWGGSNLAESTAELGNGSTALSPTPVAVIGGLTFTQISSGGAHTCALTADGEAYCWGMNDVGQLGAVTDEVCDTSFGFADPEPCSSRPVAVSGGLRFTSISAGGGHTCGVTSDGAAYCWGSNRAGQLGNGTTVGSTTPVAVAGGLTFASVSAGRGSWGRGLTCGVTRQGQAYCWGTNSFGELGIGSIIGPESCPVGPQESEGPCSTLPVAVAGTGLAFATVRAGLFHACGLTTSGTVHCFGTLGSAAPVAAVPLALPAERTYAAIDLFSGDWVSRICLVASGGTVYCRNGSESDLRALPVPGGIAFASVSLGRRHACGVARDGRAYCWGSNETGQLGNGLQVPSPVPVKVRGQP